MILEKIKTFFGIAKKGDRKEIVINIEPLESRVAMLEGGVLEEFSIERDSDRSISGNLYKGKVSNIEPALKALFVDIGTEKNAFLHYWDAIPAALDSGVERIERGGKSARHKKITANDIPKLYPPGADIIVQVSKGPIGTKGARITTNISLAGRYMVLMPFSDQFGISRKIEDSAERKRLRQILFDLAVPEGMGVILRTAGEGMKARYFVRDLAILVERWQHISADLDRTEAPALLLEEPDIVERTVRDFLTDDIDRIVVDHLETADRIKKLVGAISKRSEKKVVFHQEPVPVFEKYQVNKQVENAFRRMVWLKSGAYLVIDETEALVAIDVNTGRNKGGDDTDRTLVNTNLEAAEEVARQLRLRNIGGLIIVDFIDMKARRDQNEVVRRFKEHLKRDKAKTHVLPISPLGIMEMTRQRVQESISRSLYMECPACKGRGMVKTPESMSVEIQRELSRILGKYAEVHDLRVILHPKILDRLRTEDEALLVDLERKFACKLVFKSDHNYHFEEFKITHAETGEELR
ncbi:MAG: Rne/Rng family ribonuclease [Verrucomicrobiales bacterium]|jgi:ribonuclease G|nr:Rne/Rng family ribonuclease [Verrucomicrobiales bacterium]